MEEKDIIKLWKENNINRVEFQFSCGGDSMNDTDIVIYDNEGNEVVCDEIRNFIDNEIYDRVNFYVDSDGYYLGESGTVHITLNEDGEEPFLSYTKSSQTEWSETFNGDIEIQLDSEQATVVSKYVDNINGGEGNILVNFKTDCLLTDDEVEILAKLEEKILDEVDNFEPKGVQGELDGWYNFTTNEDGETIKIVDNKLIVSVTKTATVYKDGDDE